jgi:hypothetical protein
MTSGFLLRRRTGPKSSAAGGSSRKSELEGGLCREGGRGCSDAVLRVDSMCCCVTVFTSTCGPW